MIVALASVACGAASGPTSPSIAPSATVSTPTGSASLAPPSPSAAVSPSSPAPASSEGESDGVAVDPSLLEHLPATVDGLPVEPDAETAATIAESPGLATDASAIAIGRVVAPASDDLAVASIVRLRSGPFDDAAFGLWRTTYDRAACEPAGGVAATGEQQVAGRRVFVAACNGGARTYHVVLGDDVLVSITAIGERHLGDLLVAGLRE